ncbi:MAG: RNA polymerase sigma factor [Bacteroidaceae bacterium]|nr:RNA polymerase sigma factor [Bacteroidaceae bacterium]MBR7134949.1 RNA polymerase sigma factor [Bacteroidaceae bacterium]
MKSPEDFLWITQVLLWNDEKAFERLMMKYLPHIRRYFIIQTAGNEALSDDLTQETFIRAWRGLSGFGRLSSFSTWLYKIAFNVYASHVTKSITTLPLDNDKNAFAIADKDNFATSDIQEEVREAIYRLNEREKVCITLFYIDDMSIKDIAKITGYTTGTIKSHLARGRKNLEKILKKQ